LKGTWDFDRDPLLALARGDPAPFERFVQQETATLLAFFLRLGATRAEAEDLAQELFLKLFRHAETYQPSGRFEPFVFRVARNAWIDRTRRVEVRATGGDDDPGQAGAAALAGEESSPGLDLERREEAQRARAALAALSPAHRMVFELGVLQEVSYAEIAQLLEIPEGTVKSRMFHAVRKLRERLEGNE